MAAVRCCMLVVTLALHHRTRICCARLFPVSGSGSAAFEVMWVLGARDGIEKRQLLQGGWERLLSALEVGWDIAPQQHAPFAENFQSRGLFSLCLKGGYGMSDWFLGQGNVFQPSQVLIGPEMQEDKAGVRLQSAHSCVTASRHSDTTSFIRVAPKDDQSEVALQDSSRSRKFIDKASRTSTLSEAPQPYPALKERREVRAGQGS